MVSNRSLERKPEGNYFWERNACLDQMLAAGFDRVYLDMIDAREYFEGLQKA